MIPSKIFKNKKILIMGLGLHGGGAGVVKFFYKQGAEILVTDLKTKEQLKESLKKLKNLKIKYTLGSHSEADFLWADVVIKNPDVPNSSPFLEFAKSKNIPIETDLTLFFKYSKAFIIGVTGTKGKSTTASLIFHILKSFYKRVFLAGNIGVSPLELLPKIKEGDKVVLELSSFGLENLTQGPKIAVITNIMEDHLNRYANMTEYIQAKENIFKYQEKDNFLVLNKDDILSQKFAKDAKSKVAFFSSSPQIKLSNSKFFGKHNLYNISSAIKVAELLNVPSSKIEKAVDTFKGVASRQEFIKEFKGVKYFNDTTATMPEAVITAIDVFSAQFPKARLIFICGGQNKGLSYKDLANKIIEKVDQLVMLPGTASDKIEVELKNYKNLHKISSMRNAVRKAKTLANRGDVVVLSPGAASFNIFKNEFDRGDQFKKFVKELSNEKTL